jgi:hypothetical protein
VLVQEVGRGFAMLIANYIPFYVRLDTSFGLPARTNTTRSASAATVTGGDSSAPITGAATALYGMSDPNVQGALERLSDPTNIPCLRPLFQRLSKMNTDGGPVAFQILGNAARTAETQSHVEFHATIGRCQELIGRMAPSKQAEVDPLHSQLLRHPIVGPVLSREAESWLLSFRTHDLATVFSDVQCGDAQGPPITG